jgi:hypothetical protein
MPVQVDGIPGADMAYRIFGATAGLALLLLGAAPSAAAPDGPSAATQAEATGLDFQLMRDYRIEGRRVGLVMRDWLYCYPPTGELILVPRGYMTDFASIPGFAKPFIDEFGDNAEAAVAHDWLYAVGQAGLREKADDLFRYALMEQDVDVVTRNAMHRAVRTAGGGAYGRTGEWDRRFGDPEVSKPLPASPYRRRATAVVARLGTCKAMDDVPEVKRLRALYGSEGWPRP